MRVVYMALYVLLAMGLPADRIRCPKDAAAIGLKGAPLPWSIYRSFARSLIESIYLLKWRRSTNMAALTSLNPPLAFVDGEADPWRATSPHASPFNAMPHNRTSTSSESFIPIDGAVHQWDENSLLQNETTSMLPPAPVVSTQRSEASFVLMWQNKWEEQHH